MPWSKGVVQQFDIIDIHTTEEDEYYGSFNSLLHELFPTSEHYIVAPQPMRIDGSSEYIFQFVVYRLRIPVFFLQIKTFESLALFHARARADDHMRQSFRELISRTTPTGTLYGISAFGPQFCVYASDLSTRRIDPPAIVPDLGVIGDTAPKDRWAYNLLEPAGEAKFREVAKAVRGVTTG